MDKFYDLIIGYFSISPEDCERYRRNNMEEFLDSDLEDIERVLVSRDFYKKIIKPQEEQMKRFRGIYQDSGIYERFFKEGNEKHKRLLEAFRRNYQN